MNDYSTVTDFNDACPVHGGDIKREYDFGMYDATVIVFKGCRCACSAIDSDMGDVVYHTSYSGAAGRARLTVARNAVPLGG